MDQEHIVVSKWLRQGQQMLHACQRGSIPIPLALVSMKKWSWDEMDSFIRIPVGLAVLRDVQEHIKRRKREFHQVRHQFETLAFCHDE